MMDDNSNRREFNTDVLYMLGSGLLGGAIGPAVQAGIEWYRERRRSLSASVTVEHIEHVYPEFGPDPLKMQRSSLRLVNTGSFVERDIDGFITTNVQLDPRYGFSYGFDYSPLIGMNDSGFTTETGENLFVTREVEMDGEISSRILTKFSVPQILPQDGIWLHLFTPYYVLDVRVDGQSSDVVFWGGWQNIEPIIEYDIPEN